MGIIIQAAMPVGGYQSWRWNKPFSCFMIAIPSPRRFLVQGQLSSLLISLSLAAFISVALDQFSAAASAKVISKMCQSASPQCVQLIAAVWSPSRSQRLIRAPSALCVMSRDTSCLAVDAKLWRKFPERVLVLLSPMLFISGLSMDPNPQARILPSRSLCFLSLRFGWHLGLYSGVWRVFGLVVPAVSGSSLEFARAVWSRCSFYMILVIWSICLMGRKIVFELRRGESAVVNKMNAGLHPDVVQWWKCLRFLPPAGGRSFWVHSLAFGSPYPLTTRLFSLLLRPSAPNSWTFTRSHNHPKGSAPLLRLHKV